FIDGVEAGEIRFHPSRGFEERVLEQQSYQTSRTVKAVLASGLMVAGAQLLAQYYLPGLILITVGLLTALTVLGRGGRRRVRKNAGRMGSGFKKPRLHP
ncbi:MAG TPA: AarF/ABC1/UbiB kinase family protein, partial [Bacillota bacterium]|nr:AarF/ABC1/UbiB kinase family protein [Bacillota bacterium]